MTSTFLGTSSGLRLRHDQPAGTVDINAKSADLARSAWAGQATRDFTDVDVGALHADLTRRLGWARRRVDLPAGRYQTLLPPAAVADLLIYLYWSAGAKDALDGRTVFSKPGGGTRIGERLSGLPLTLRSDPAARRAGVRPVRDRARLQPRVVGVRQRPARCGRPSGSRAASSPRSSRPGTPPTCPGWPSPRRSGT